MVKHIDRLAAAVIGPANRLRPEDFQVGNLRDNALDGFLLGIRNAHRCIRLVERSFRLHSGDRPNGPHIVGAPPSSEVVLYLLTITLREVIVNVGETLGSSW